MHTSIKVAHIYLLLLYHTNFSFTAFSLMTRSHSNAEGMQKNLCALDARALGINVRPSYTSTGNDLSF